MNTIENIILSNLIKDEKFLVKTIPYIQAEYFEDRGEKIVFKKIEDFADKYKKSPTIKELLVEINQDRTIEEGLYVSVKEVMERLDLDEDYDNDWLIEKSEKFCQEMALKLAIHKSIDIFDGTEKNLPKSAIPQILTNALGVSFDSYLGHNYLEDFEKRYDFYHKQEYKIPFDIEYLNQITRGGVSSKTLNVLMASTGIGKTLCLCHFAANYMVEGKNVLYITLEMSEEFIGQRIDANLMDVPVEEIEILPREEYMKKAKYIRSLQPGKLVIKEYPTAACNINHIRNFVNELALKERFVPDVIIIDYINIMCPVRFKGGRSIGMYEYVKAVTEEVRGFAVEKDLPIWSATQTNRTGSDSSDPDMTDVSESFGLPQTLDLFLVLISDDNLKKQQRIIFKQLKNRYGRDDNPKKFVVGIDRARMKLYNVGFDEQDITDGPDFDDGPIMDETKFGQHDNERSQRIRNLIT